MLHFIMFLLIGAWSNPILEGGSCDSRKGEDKVIAAAEELINTRYRFGGNAPSGFDCSGFTQYVYRKAIRITLPRRSADQFRKGKRVKLKNCQPGDLIFFSYSSKVNHVGIIHKKTNRGIWMIHSSSSRGVISEEITCSNYWNKRISGVKRLL